MGVRRVGPRLPEAGCAELDTAQLWWDRPCESEAVLSSWPLSSHIGESPAACAAHSVAQPE